MGAIDTNYTFTATDVITSTKMNNILDQSTITATATFNDTLAVSSGKLLVKTGGITSNEIAVGAVVTAGILNGAVTAGKLATDAVETVKIKDVNVTAAKLATDAVETAKIKNANVTAEKLSGAQTGTAPIYGARAWVVFDMTRNAAGDSNTDNTTRYIYPNGNGNVTSVTKNGTGDCTIAFTNDMPHANYAMVGMVQGTSSNPSAILSYQTSGGSIQTKSTSQARITTRDNNSDAAYNQELCEIVFFA